MSESAHEKRSANKPKQHATAGPSQDDRFGAGPVASNLQGRIIRHEVSNDRLRIAIAGGKEHGVRLGMEGYVKTGIGMLCEFQIDEVKTRVSYAFIDVTTTDLGGHHRVVINPSSKPRVPAPWDLRTRVIGVGVEGSMTKVTLARGSAHGVRAGLRGHLLSADGREGPDFEIGQALPIRSVAYLTATVDQVNQHQLAVINPSASRTASSPVQRRATGAAATADVQPTAQAGVVGAASTLPHLDAIQRSFGKHDVSGVQAQVGGPATQATQALGAQAYATGTKVAFASSPDLHTAAHEAAHTIQQKHGAVGFQGLGAADDAHERHADQVADAVVAGQSAEPLLDQVAGGGSPSAGAVQRKPAPAPSMGSAPAQPQAEPGPAPGPLGGGHGSHELKLEFDEGSVTGGVTATIEYGKTGLPVGADKLQAFKNTASMKLNGTVAKLETAVLNGEMDFDVLDGVKVSVEMSAMNVGVDGTDLETDLLTVSLKLVGDVGHWLDAGPNVTLTIDGRVSIAIGDKLAAKLAKHKLAQLEQRMLAKEIGVIGDTLDNHVRAIKDLEAKLSLVDARAPGSVSRQVRDQMQREIFERKLQLSTGSRQLKGLTGKLAEAKEKADALFKRLEGKLAKGVARAMQQKTVKFVALKLAKLVPVLNVISTIIDVIELVGAIRALLKGQYGGEGGEGGGNAKKTEGDYNDGGKDSKDKESKDTGSKDKMSKDGKEHDVANGPEARSSGATQEPSPKSKQEAVARAREQLSPAARAVVDSLTSKGTSGPELDVEQLTAIGTIVPTDLTPDELTAMLAVLRDKPGKARTAAQVIDAIEGAVREVRDREGAKTADGEAGGAASPGHVGAEGPITSPSQVDGGEDAKHGPATLDALAIVRGFPAEIAGQWFEVRNGVLEMNAVGKQWKATHQGALIDGQTTLKNVYPVTTDTGNNKWELTMTFELLVEREKKRINHHFFVERGGEYSGIGARVGELLFEPYAVIGRP